MIIDFFLIICNPKMHFYDLVLVFGYSNISVTIFGHFQKEPLPKTDLQFLRIWKKWLKSKQIQNVENSSIVLIICSPTIHFYITTNSDVRIFRKLFSDSFERNNFLKLIKVSQYLGENGESPTNPKYAETDQHIYNPTKNKKKKNT